MSAPLMLTIHWSSGGETSVQTNDKTVHEMMQLVRRGELAALTSEPGEPLWMLCVAPGGASGMSVRAAGEQGMVSVPHQAVIAALPALLAMRGVLAAMPDVAVEHVQAGLSLIGLLIGDMGREEAADERV